MSESARPCAPDATHAAESRPAGAQRQRGGGSSDRQRCAGGERTDQSKATGASAAIGAGHDIVNGEIGGVSAGSVPGTLANLTSTGLNATSGVRAVATNFAEFYAGAGQANSFASDLDIRAPGRAWVNATGAGTSLTIVRDLVANSDRAATVAGGSATGGSAALYTNADGAITVGRNATVTANGTGASSSTVGIAGGSGTGGGAVIQNQGDRKSVG